MDEIITITQNLPDRKSDLFHPYYCWFENGEYSDFWPSKSQVAMCHDFNPKDEHIIEVDIRVATTCADAEYFGICDDNGFFHSIYFVARFKNVMESLLRICGPRSNWVPVNITDMRYLAQKRIQYSGVSERTDIDDGIVIDQRKCLN